MLKLASPLFIAQLAQTGTGVIDTIMAGRYSSVDLAAIAIGYNIWLPIYMVSLGIMFGVTAIVAQHYGAGRFEEIRRSLPQAIWVALVLGLLSIPLCYYPAVILDQLALDPLTAAKAEAYLRAVAFGLPGAALFQALRCHVQAVGIVRPFAVASVIGFVANIPLNYIFIYGFWGIPEMGAAGCGWATAISMWLGPLLIGFYTVRSTSLRKYLPALQWYWPQWAVVKEILYVGVPIGITFFFEMAVFAFIGLLIATSGITAMAAHQIAINTYDVLYMPLISIGSAMATRIGHAIGRQDMPGVKTCIEAGLMISVALCVCITLVLVLVPDAIATIYTKQPDILLLADKLLKMAALFVVVDMLMIISSFSLRAFKDTRFPFMVTTVSYWMLALPLGYYLGLSDKSSELHGPLGFWWGMIAGITLAALLTCWRLLVFLKRPLQPVRSGRTADSVAA